MIRLIEAESRSPVQARPYSALHVLHSQETLVQAQIVANGVLPSGRIAAEVAKRGLEPVIDLIQSQLSVWRFDDGLREGNKVIRNRMIRTVFFGLSEFEPPDKAPRRSPVLLNLHRCMEAEHRCSSSIRGFCSCRR